MAHNSTEKRRAWGRKWYLENRDRLRVKRAAYSRELRRTNPEYRKRQHEVSSAWSKLHPESHRQYKRNYRLKNIYKISQEELDALIKAQYGKCAICKKEPKIGVLLHIDHDHQTGKVRGLLCHKCNSVLGLSNDNLDVLREAVKYLETHSEFPLLK